MPLKGGGRVVATRPENLGIQPWPVAHRQSVEEALGITGRGASTVLRCGATSTMSGSRGAELMSKGLFNID